MNGLVRSAAGAMAALTLISAAGIFGCGGATPDAGIASADAVEVTFYYLPG